MNISKKSMHYRFIKMMKNDFDPMPRDLCSYIFTLIFMVLKFILIVSVFYLSLLGMGGLWVDTPNGILPHHYILLPMLGAVTISVLLAILVTIGYINHKIKSKRKDKPSLVNQYIKDRKSKRCSIIKYED